MHENMKALYLCTCGKVVVLLRIHLDNPDIIQCPLCRLPLSPDHGTLFVPDRVVEEFEMTDEQFLKAVGIAEGDTFKNEEVASSLHRALSVPKPCNLTKPAPWRILSSIGKWPRTH